MSEWETEMGQARRGSDGLLVTHDLQNNQGLIASLESCGKVIRTSTSHHAAIYLIFRIHTLMQLELPDVEPPVEKGAQIKSKMILPEN